MELLGGILVDCIHWRRQKFTGNPCALTGTAVKVMDHKISSKTCNSRFNHKVNIVD